MMLFFTKRYSLAGSGMLHGFTDYHSHLLPGVDDGVQTVDESLALLACFERLGFVEVWLTPHVMEEIPNTTDGLKRRFGDLEAAYTGKISLRLAAEYMLDNLFDERLAANDLLPLGKTGDCLLVETSCYNPPMNLYGILEKIKSKGYYPVLAHPERYDYMSEDGYRKLKDTGVRFQMNLPALVGAYGSKVRKKAVRLLKLGLYDVSGTDAHSLETFRRMVFANKKIYANLPAI